MHPIPTAKLALKTILAARPAWTDVDIRDGQPTEPDDVKRSAFWFEPTEIDADSWASLGAQRRRITFRLGFTLAVIDNDSESGAEDAMWTLYEDLLAAIKASPGLSDTIQATSDVAGKQANEPISTMWRAVFTGTIECLSKAY
jgi:hypothetical protein